MFYGPEDVRMEEKPIPAVGEGEVLVGRAERADNIGKQNICVRLQENESEEGPCGNPDLFPWSHTEAGVEHRAWYAHCSPKREVA